MPQSTYCGQICWASKSTFGKELSFCLRDALVWTSAFAILVWTYPGLRGLSPTTCDPPRGVPAVGRARVCSLHMDKDVVWGRQGKTQKAKHGRRVPVTASSASKVNPLHSTRRGQGGVLLMCSRPIVHIGTLPSLVCFCDSSRWLHHNTWHALSRDLASPKRPPRLVSAAAVRQPHPSFLLGASASASGAPLVQAGTKSGETMVTRRLRSSTM